MIICAKCSKENQDHYKFCLGCGSELPREAPPRRAASPAAAPAPMFVDEGTSQGQGYQPSAPAARIDEPVVAAPVAAASAAAAPAGPILCPQCGHENGATNKFCAACGFKLVRASVVAPVPEPSVATPTAAAPTATPAVSLVLTALRADGSEAGTFHAGPGPITAGRDSGGIFAGDSYLSPKHATFTVRGNQVVVRDESSLNGVYRRIPRDEAHELAFGDIFRIGQEILRIEQLVAPPKSADGVERLGSPARGYFARLALLIGRDTTGNAYPIPEAGLHLGRERGDVLFPEDGYVSGLHCRLSVTGGKLFLTDLGSSNGSFLRIMRDTVVAPGDILLMGQQLFRIGLAA